MFAPDVQETHKCLVVTGSFWLKIASIPVFLFFLCWMLGTLAAPIWFITGGNTPAGWVMYAALAALLAVPTRLFWQGCQPIELRLCFDEGCYEIRRGFRRFSRTLKGPFREIDHLTIWSKHENSRDVSYTTSLIWNVKRLPFTLRFSYNDQQEALDWSQSVADRLHVALYNRIQI